jgi:hypothetical protein
MSLAEAYGTDTFGSQGCYPEPAPQPHHHTDRAADPLELIMAQYPGLIISSEAKAALLGNIDTGLGVRMVGSMAVEESRVSA